MTSLARVAVCVVAFAEGACGGALLPVERTAPEPGEVQFELAGPGGAAVVVPVKVNQTGPYSFVLDTGATLTCVDEQLAKDLDLPQPAGTIRFGVGLRGQGQMRLVSIKTLEVGNAKHRDLTGCALDLQSLRASGLEVKGLLGLNFLKSYRMTLDFTDRTLRLDLPGDRSQ